MTNLEERVHRALQHQVQQTLSQPDPADLRARVSRARIRRQRKRIAVASLAVVVAATTVTLALWQSGSSPTGPASTSASVNVGACPFTRYLPFRLTYLPGDAPLPAQPLMFGARNFAFWAFPGGEIEIVRGADRPHVSGPTQPIVVLGQTGRVGSISDGYSVVFNLDHSNDPCKQWALVSHPGTTLEETRAIAEGLVPA
jgi:hypothetical protein